MREKLNTLPLSQLREIAKENGVKSVTTIRKAELVELLAGLYEKNAGKSEEKVEENKPAKTEVQTEALNSETENSDDNQSDDVKKDEAKRSRSYGSMQETKKRQMYSASDSQSEKSAASEGIKNNEQKASRTDDMQQLESGSPAHGILEVMSEGYGFIRCDNYMPGDEDVYVAPSQIRRFNLKTGDIIKGVTRVKSNTEKFAALLYINSVNDEPPYVAEKRPNFEDLTPIFPNEKLNLSENSKDMISLRIIDLLSPIGKGQRGMIVSPPKAGKTTLLKQIAHAITENHKDMHIIILLIDERPEEVTDIKEYIEGPNVEVIYSTFDELPEHHKRVSEMVLERARRLVEHGRDVTILLDSITRLARAYNLLVNSSGRTLSGGLDPTALYAPKKFFGAARNMREGGSLTILATALVETGSRMDDVVFEEFKGTGNMELVLNRKLSEKRIFPAIDIQRSGTRRDDLLLTQKELAAVDIIHKNTVDSKNEDAVERVLDVFRRMKTKEEVVERILLQKN